MFDRAVKVEIFIYWLVSVKNSFSLYQSSQTFYDFAIKNAFIYISHLFVFKFSLALVKEGFFKILHCAFKIY